MSVTPHSGTGTVLRLGSAVYSATNIVITNTDPQADAEQIDISHLGLSTGNSIATLQRPLQGSTSDTGRQIQFDYLGNVQIADASTGTCSISVGGTAVFSSIAYTVASSTLTLALNDAIRGQATLRIARA
jgi:hypothetical protein